MAPTFVQRLLPLFAQVYTGTLVYSVRSVYGSFLKFLFIGGLSIQLIKQLRSNGLKLFLFG